MVRGRNSSLFQCILLFSDARVRLSGVAWPPGVAKLCESYQETLVCLQNLIAIQLTEMDRCLMAV